MPEINFIDFGLVDYETALQSQMNLASDVAGGRGPDTVIFCTHPPVVTLGRATRPGDVFGWRGKTVEISRGGRATYHGPSQLVVYPILNLNLPRWGFAARDLHGYMRALEAAIVQTIEVYGVHASGGRHQDAADPSDARAVSRDGSEQATHADEIRAARDDLAEPSATGVWIGDRKIASIGIGVRKWVSYHGAAINLHHDAQAFAGLNPCGFKSQTMISLEELVDHPIDSAAFQARLREHLARQLRIQ